MKTRITLRVAPGARRSGVAGRHGSGWKIRVAAAPADGKANTAVIALLADTLNVPRRDVEIVSGRGSQDKTVALTGISLDETERRLIAASTPGKDLE